MNTSLQGCVLFLFVIIQLADSLQSNLFQRTVNISKNTFANKQKMLTKASSILDCAQKCHYFDIMNEKFCNALSYHSNGDCQLAYLTYLENPQPGDVEQEIFVSSLDAKNMDMTCRGGEHCCNKDKKTLCGVGQGDCNSDNDCANNLICGTNNCLQLNGLSSASGLWDADDDCCDRRCTPEHPCNEGQGPCSSDSDCENSGWSKCGGDKCLNPTYFPPDVYWNNTPTYGYSTSDDCCYRVCNKNYHICGNGEVGCKFDDDCSAGLYCDTSIPKPKCVDLDECDGSNGIFLGEWYCGRNSVCTNTVGTVTCPCNSGFVDFSPYIGCRDKDECAEGGNNCGANSQCWNTPGSFICTCKEGFVGDPIAGCTDIDECSQPNLNTCKSASNVYNTETFSDEAMKFFFIGKSPDSFSKSVKFEVSGMTESYFLLCEKARFENCYQFGIGLSSNSKMELSKCKMTTPSGCQILDTKSHETTSKQSLSVDASTFWMKLELSNSQLIVTAGASDAAVHLSATDLSGKISVSYIGVRTLGKLQTTYWRNMRVDQVSETCSNFEGGYSCINNTQEMAGIGFGGHTTSSSEYRGELSVVTNDMTVCSSHIIPTLSGRFAPGIAALDNWLYVCGGNFYGAEKPLSECWKVNMNSKSPSWKSATALPKARRGHAMVTVGASIFVIGGYNFWSGDYECLSDVYEYGTSNDWKSMAEYPIKIVGNSVTVDIDENVLYSMGGHTCRCCDRAEVYMYTVSTNTWIHHSSLPWSSNQLSSSIIRRTSGEKWLLVVGGARSGASITYYDMTNDINWKVISSLRNGYKQFKMRMLSLTPYSAVLLGGQSQRFGYNLRNIWEFNPSTNTFEDGYFYLTNEMHESAWTTINKSYRALQNCFSFVTYAAVGWGGHTSSGSVYNPNWNVLLRSRALKGDSKFPVACPYTTGSGQQGIPPLSPARMWTGVAAVGYRLMVCGGYVYGKSVDNLCFYIDTNNRTSTWMTMEPMLRNRKYFTFTTYGDSAYAIGGYDTNSMNQVDRWTLTKGWTNVADYPRPNIRQHCSVADEGYDAIYTLGGYICNPSCTAINNVYKYTISTDSWSSLNVNMPKTRYEFQCGILHRRRDNHRMMYIFGRDSYVAYYDLTVMNGWWSMPTMDASVYMGAFISLTPYEGYLVGGYNSRHSHSKRNWYLFDPVDNRPEDIGLTLSYISTGGGWSRIPQDAAMLKTCTR